MKGIVKFFNSRGLGFVKAGLSCDVRIFADRHVEHVAGDVYKQKPPQPDIGTGDEVELIIVVESPKGLDAPAWRWLKAEPRPAIDTLERLEQGRMKFYLKPEAYGFVIA